MQKLMTSQITFPTKDYFLKTDPNTRMLYQTEHFVLLADAGSDPYDAFFDRRANYVMVNKETGMIESAFIYAFSARKQMDQLEAIIAGKGPEVTVFQLGNGPDTPIQSH